MLLTVPANELLAILLFVVIALIVITIVIAIITLLTGTSGGLITNVRRNLNSRSLDKDLRRRERQDKQRSKD